MLTWWRSEPDTTWSRRTTTAERVQLRAQTAEEPRAEAPTLPEALVLNKDLELLVTWSALAPAVVVAKQQLALAVERAVKANEPFHTCLEQLLCIRMLLRSCTLPRRLDYSTAIQHSLFTRFCVLTKMWESQMNEFFFFE
jgi:hypothetical protein